MVKRAEPVAVLTRVIDAEWGPTDLPTDVGFAIPTGRLRLKSGLVQLEFLRGPIVVLQGPADFELLGPDRAFCREGKLRVRVSSQSSKFSVETPNADVIDLGTEFGVRVDAFGGAAVRVFEGKVELYGKGPAGASAVAREVVSGQSVGVDSSGTVRATDPPAESFIGVRELDQRSSTESGRRYRAWASLSRKLQTDRRLILYYSFEGQQRWERTLRDQVTSRTPGIGGAAVGTQWAEGRWPGKGALEFKRPNDRVRIHVPDEYQALTLMAWVRVDGFDRTFSSLLLSDGWQERGKMHWQLDNEGHLILDISCWPEKGPRLQSPTILGRESLGLWTNLTTVFDGRARAMVHYIDGREVSRRETPRGVTVRLGWAEIGNWNSPLPGGGDPIRNLNGRMDEFILFNQPLEAKEIQAMVEIGKPGS
jgi:hypothetical protein